MVVRKMVDRIQEFGAVGYHTAIIGETVLTRVVGHGVVLSSGLLPLAGVCTVEARGAIGLRTIVI